MLVKDFLKLAYKPKKDGNLPKVAISFMVKYELKEEQDMSVQELILIAQHLSSKDKRITIITELLNKIEDNNTKAQCNVGEWRTKSYKQVARMVHPDSDTGDTESFQFLQEIKEYLWDYKGEPRKEIGLWEWKAEKTYKERGGVKYGFSYTGE